MVNRQQRLNRHEKDNVDLSDDFITDVVENFTAADKGIFAKAGITVQDGQRPPSDIVDTNRCKPKGRNQKETEESKGRRANPENNWHGLLFVLTKGGKTSAESVHVPLFVRVLFLFRRPNHAGTLFASPNHAACRIVSLSAFFFRTSTKPISTWQQ